MHIAVKPSHRWQREPSLNMQLADLLIDDRVLLNKLPEQIFLQMTESTAYSS